MKRISAARLKIIVALWFNDALQEWSPIPFTLDSVENRIITHTTHFSLFGFFVKPVATVTASVKLLPAFGINASMRSDNITIDIVYNPQSIARGVIRLYSVNGKLVKEAALAVNRHGKSTVLLDCSDLAGGIYMLTFNNGKNHVCKAVTIMK